MTFNWDQGRKDYFELSKIKLLAKVLVQFDGENIKTRKDDFRDALVRNTGLPFSPAHYTVKRNYKRVFECSLLATFQDDVLRVSDICRGLALEDDYLVNNDGYLYEVESRFRYPFYAFSSYNTTDPICFPFLAIQKYLVAKVLNSGDITSSISSSEVYRVLVQGNVSGLEDLTFYQSLQEDTTIICPDTEIRQIRELMFFIGQHDYLSFSKNELRFASMTIDSCRDLFSQLTPRKESTTIAGSEFEDFEKITSDISFHHVIVTTSDEDETSLGTFHTAEGKRVFISHFSRERSRSLRRDFIKHNPNPVCDVCGANMAKIYPWTEYLLDIHHIEPLASTDVVRVTTSSNVVGICPTCHRAIHNYYKKWLNLHCKDDFDSFEEAKSVYDEAKLQIKKQ